MKLASFLIVLIIIPSAFAIEGLKLSVYADDELTVGTTYTKLFKIENLDHVSGVKSNIDVCIGYNVSGVKEDYFEIKGLNKYKYAGTGEFTPEMIGNYTLCGWIINSSVNDTNQEDDFACKNITVIGQSSNATADESEEESWIKIKEAPNEASFGDIIEIEVEIYKGDTRKYAVYAEVDDAGEKTTMHLKGKYSEYSINIPLKIKPNCNNRYEEGEYEIVVEGLDAEDTEDIYVYGHNEDVCVKETIVETIVINETRTEIIREECPSDEKLLDVAKVKLTADLDSKRTVYESSSEKAEQLIPLIIICILILFLAVLIWKR